MKLLTLVIIVLIIYLTESFLYKKYGLKGVAYKCRFSCDEACEGDEIELIEEITNAKRLPLPWVKAELTAPLALEFGELQSSVTDTSRFVSSFFVLKGCSRITRRWKLKCRRRGIYSISAVTVVGADLFGTMNFSLPMDKSYYSHRLVILPKPAENIPAFPADNMLTGENTVPISLISDPFFIGGVRPYTLSDPMRSINWNASAKEQRLMCSTYEFTENRRTLVILNMQSRENENKSVFDPESVEYCIKICAGIFIEAEKRNSPCAFAANCNMDDSMCYIPDGCGKSHTYRLMYALAGLPLGNAARFDDFLAASDFIDEYNDIIIVCTHISAGTALLSREPSVRIIAVTAEGTDRLPREADVTIIKHSERTDRS